MAAWSSTAASASARFLSVRSQRKEKSGGGGEKGCARVRVLRARGGFIGEEEEQVVSFGSVVVQLFSHGVGTFPERGVLGG
jgi:hypothetical protein